MVLITCTGSKVKATSSLHQAPLFSPDCPFSSSLLLYRQAPAGLNTPQSRPRAHSLLLLLYCVVVDDVGHMSTFSPGLQNGNVVCLLRAVQRQQQQQQRCCNSSRSNNHTSASVLAATGSSKRVNHSTCLPPFPPPFLPPVCVHTYTKVVVLLLLPYTTAAAAATTKAAAWFWLCVAVAVDIALQTSEIYRPERNGQRGGNKRKHTTHKLCMRERGRRERRERRELCMKGRAVMKAEG